MKNGFLGNLGPDAIVAEPTKVLSTGSSSTHKAG